MPLWHAEHAANLTLLGDLRSENRRRCLRYPACRRVLCSSDNQWCKDCHKVPGSVCRIDMVLVGAEGVVENGGVINKLGTYQAAVSSYCHNTPFYVAAESYKVHVHLSL